MGAARFRYALQPLLLTRQWDLEALLRELAGQNEAVARQEAALAALRARSALAADEWSALSQASGHLSVDRFSMLAAYLNDLAGLVRASALVLDQLNAERDLLIERVAAAQRAIEAIEEHRDAMQAKFVQLRASGDYKLADDQWNTLQTGSANDGYH